MTRATGDRAEVSPAQPVFLILSLQANSDKLLCSVPVNLQVSDVDVGGNGVWIACKLQLGKETTGELSRSLYVW